MVDDKSNSYDVFRDGCNGEKMSEDYRCVHVYGECCKCDGKLCCSIAVPAFDNYGDYGEDEEAAENVMVFDVCGFIVTRRLLYSKS